MDNSRKKEREKSSRSTHSKSVTDNTMEWKDRDHGNEENEAQTEEEHSGKGANRKPINVDDNKEENIRVAMKDEENEDNENNITKGNEGGNREEGESRLTMRLEDDRKEESDLGIRRRKRWMEGEEEEHTERMAIPDKQEHEESNPNNEGGSARHKVWEDRLEKYTPSLLILSFLIFNLVYWPYWLNRHTHNVQDMDS